MKSGSLFTGTAALDMAAAEVLGAEPAWFADLDPAAAALLAHHYPGVPNLGDITEADWDLVALLAPVDLVTGGWPCQPFSLAGKQKGADDDRALWPEVDRCLRALRPRYVLLENVPAVVTAGELERVATSLATLGYRFAWVCIPASAVGAPHRRERFFLLAALGDTAVCGRDDAPAPGRRRESTWPVGGPGVAAADTAVPGLQGSFAPGSSSGAESETHPNAERNSGASAPDADNCGRTARVQPQRAHEDRDAQPWNELDGHRLEWAGYEPAIRRWESILGRPAPVPTIRGARGGRVLNPELPEWMMGLPGGWITGVPGLSRAQQLKLAGNGVVPRQAVAAYRYLLGVLDEDARAAA